MHEKTIFKAEIIINTQTISPNEKTAGGSWSLGKEATQNNIKHK